MATKKKIGDKVTCGTKNEHIIAGLDAIKSHLGGCNVLCLDKDCFRYLNDHKKMFGFGVVEFSNPTNGETYLYDEESDEHIQIDGNTRVSIDKYAVNGKCKEYDVRFNSAMKSKIEDSDVIIADIVDSPCKVIDKLSQMFFDTKKKFFIRLPRLATYDGGGRIFNLIKSGECHFLPFRGNNPSEKNAALWFTNMSFKTNLPDVTLYKTYSEKEYKKYTTIDAIEVSDVRDIPIDYDGEMGVPTSFLEKNISGFEICEWKKAHTLKVGKEWKNLRIIIKRKNPTMKVQPTMQSTNPVTNHTTNNKVRGQAAPIIVENSNVDSAIRNWEKKLNEFMRSKDVNSYIMMKNVINMSGVFCVEEKVDVEHGFDPYVVVRRK